MSVCYSFHYLIIARVFFNWFFLSTCLFQYFQKEIFFQYMYIIGPAPTSGIASSFLSWPCKLWAAYKFVYYYHYTVYVHTSICTSDIIYNIVTLVHPSLAQGKRRPISQSLPPSYETPDIARNTCRGISSPVTIAPEANETASCLPKLCVLQKGRWLLGHTGVQLKQVQWLYFNMKHQSNCVRPTKWNNCGLRCRAEVHCTSSLIRTWRRSRQKPFCTEFWMEKSLLVTVPVSRSMGGRPV